VPNSTTALTLLASASGRYAAALARWPGLGRAFNLLGVASVASGDEALAASYFLRGAFATPVPFRAAADNAAPLLAAAASRPLRSSASGNSGASGSTSYVANAAAELAETRLLRCVGHVIARTGFDTFDAAAWSAAGAADAALRGGLLSEAAALRCVGAAAAAVHAATPAGWRAKDAPPDAWPEWLVRHTHAHFLLLCS
jgi:hypothetical protein